MHQIIVSEFLKSPVLEDSPDPPLSQSGVRVSWGYMAGQVGVREYNIGDGGKRKNVINDNALIYSMIVIRR